MPLNRAGALHIAAAVPALVAALGIGVLLVLVLQRAVEIPFGDEWDWVDLLYAAHRHTLTFAQLWAPHNEHRIVIPNLIMLGLAAFGGWSVVREQVLSLVLLALTQLGVWALIRRTVPAGRRGVCFLAATALMLGLAQYENLDWGFQFAWFLCDLCVVVAVWGLTRAHASPRDLTVASAVALVASLSSSQGLVVWPAGLVAIAFVPRGRARRALVWLALGIVVTAVVRPGSPQAAAPGHVGLARVDLILHYTLTYLGAPLARAYGPHAAAQAGAALIGWLAALVAFALRAPLSRRVRLAPWLALASYPMLCAVLTAAGRAGFGVVQATAPRYTSIAELAWVAALAATCILLPRGTALRFAVAAGAAAVLLIASLRQSEAGNVAWKLHAAELRAARSALAAGDRRGLAAVYPDADRTVIRLGELARIRDGVFAPR